MNCETVKSVTLLNLVPRSYALVRTEIHSRSIGLPWKKVSLKWDPQSRELEKFGKSTQGKRKQGVYENQIKVL